MYMWITVTQMNGFGAFLCLNTALNPNNFGFIEEFHTEKMLSVDLFDILIFLRDFIPCDFVFGIPIPS